MAELLIRVIDKVNPDFYKNCQCTKRGDVIAVCPDGNRWGDRELNAPHYRIIKMPKMTVEEGSILLAPEPEKDPSNPSRTLQRRAFKIDLDSKDIPADITAYIDDPSLSKAIMIVEDTEDEVNAKVVTEVKKYADLKESVEIASAVFTKNELMALVVVRPPIEDPSVIGDVIGFLNAR